jgi:hypothetical protein
MISGGNIAAYMIEHSERTNFRSIEKLVDGPQGFAVLSVADSD